jgi:hypothetical protein
MIQTVATNTIGYTRNTQEWFDKECAKVNEEKKSQKYLQTSLDEKEAFVQKKGKAARRGGFIRD